MTECLHMQAVGSLDNKTWLGHYQLVDTGHCGHCGHCIQPATAGNCPHVQPEDDHLVHNGRHHPGHSCQCRVAGTTLGPQESSVHGHRPHCTGACVIM